MSDLYEKTIRTTPIFQGKIISLQIDDVQLPNGKEGKREIVKHPGAVAVIPVTKEGNIILVKQFRKALEKEIYEIPAGKLERGEDPFECAVRELREETGYTSSSLCFITSFYTSPGFADELIYIYEAEGLIAGEVQPDEDEFVEVIEVHLAEALKMVEKQLIHDAKTQYALQYLQIKRLEQQR